MTNAQIKAAVRRRDGMRCAKCGMTDAAHRARYRKALDVHRLVPGSAYSITPGACVTLCQVCHGPEPRRPWGQRFQDGERVCFRFRASLAAALDNYIDAQEVEVTHAAVLTAALEEFLERRGYLKENGK